MDEYSLHQVMVNEHCSKVSARMKHPIICKSVVDVSLESGCSNRLLSLTESLDAIQKDHPEMQIDVVVDELDGEDLNEEETMNLKTKLESPGFESSLFYLSLQSCKKKRLLIHNVERKETATLFNELGIQVFQLEKTMRFTSNIGNTVLDSQTKVEEKPNVYLCNLPTPELKQLPQSDITEKPSASLTLEIGEVDQTFEIPANLDTNESNPDLKVHSPRKMTVPTMKMDSYLKNFTGSKNSSTKVISHFEYFKAKGSGVNIQGDKPNFMRLQNKTAVSHLTYFLENYCQVEDKVMVISNTKDMITLAKAAMKTVKLSYVEYTNSLRSLPAPTTLEKKSILNKWRNNAQVLLTDCRGCRGMECKEVIRLMKNKFFSIQLFSLNLFSLSNQIGCRLMG